MREGQEIAEVVTDAECKIGELIRKIPKNNVGRPTKNISPHVDNLPNKSSVLKENGISQRQAEHFQNVIHLLIQSDSRMIHSDSELIHHDSKRFKAELKRRLQGEIQRTGPELDAQRTFSGPDPIGE